MAHIRRKLEPDPANPRFFIHEPAWVTDSKNPRSEREDHRRRWLVVLHRGRCRRDLLEALVPTRPTRRSTRVLAPAAPSALTVNGSSRVGVDPDHVAFAWHDTDARENAKQVRVPPAGLEATESVAGAAGVVWDQTRRSGRQAFVGYERAEARARHAVWWTVQTTTAVRTANTAQSAEPKVGSFATGPAVRHGTAQHRLEAQWVRPGR